MTTYFWLDLQYISSWVEKVTKKCNMKLKFLWGMLVPRSVVPHSSWLHQISPLSVRFGIQKLQILKPMFDSNSSNFRPVPLQPSNSENLTCKQQANPHSLPECMLTIDQVRQAPFRFLEPSLHWPLCGPLAGHTWCLLYEATLALPVAQRGNGKDGASADSPHPECQSQIKV